MIINKNPSTPISGFYVPVNLLIKSTTDFPNTQFRH